MARQQLVSIFSSTAMIVAGTSVLVATTIFYWSCRFEPPYIIEFLSNDSNLRECGVGFWSLSGPSFGHALGFSLLSAALLTRTIQNAIFCAALWIVVCAIFEILSSQRAADLANFMPYSFAELLARGTFDFDDLWAALAGGVTGAFVLLCTSLKTASKKSRIQHDD